MKTTQIIPFERNRYYYGKMLTSPDFRAEQQYMNHKRMFLNQITLGQGVLCGLNIFNLDDLSVLIESGAAIDPLGREIVVEKSVVRKLSALKGYREDGSGRLSLCLRYKEEEVQPVYAVNRKEDQDEYENNRIREGYELFLTDAEELENAFELDSEFFVETELLRDEDYQIWMRMPANACRGKKIRISLEVKKISSREKELSFAYELQLPAFTARDGSRKLEIREDSVLLSQGGQLNFDYWIYTLPVPLHETSILVKPEKGAEVELKVLLTDEEPETLILESLAKPSLELREGADSKDFICLADLHMTHTNTACMIERIEEKGIKNYISVPAGETKRAQYLSYYMSGEGESLKHADTAAGGEVLRQQEEPGSQEKQPGVMLFPDSLPEIVSLPYIDMEQGGRGEIGSTAVEEASPGQRKERSGDPGAAGRTAGGTLEIPLEQRMKKGTVCFSEEISHGLGPGNVYVAVGVEELKSGANAKKQIRSTVYGDTELFSRKDPALANIKTAVRVWEERGTFQAAVSLNGEQNTVLLSLRWAAVKLPGVTEDMVVEQVEPMQITPEHMTVNLRPKEKHYFAVQFHNMQPCSLKYELTETGSGKLGEDGTYTAPLRAGVYELKISCEEYPEICTYAYAVVSGKQ